VYDSSGNRVSPGFGITAADGSYTVAGMIPASAGYTVCFEAPSFVTGGPSNTGYQNQCYKSISWNGVSPPSVGTMPVRLTAGSTTTGIDAILATGGAISGVVTAPSGAGISNAYLQVYDAAGHLLNDKTNNGETDANGNYTVTGLPASTSGYVVCFQAYAPYQDQCYSNIAWDGASNPPAGTTPVPVTISATTTGINGSLTTAP